jgi:hypothetical protein
MFPACMPSLSNEKAERRQCRCAGAVLGWHDRQTKMAGLAEVRASEKEREALPLEL